MGKKKRVIDKNVVARNPDDFLNDLKFIRKNREKKEMEAEKAKISDDQSSGFDS